MSTIDGALGLVVVSGSVKSHERHFKMSSQVTLATLWFHQETGGKHAYPRGLLNDTGATSARGAFCKTVESSGIIEGKRLT